MESNYNFCSSQNSNKKQLNATNKEVRENWQVMHHTIAKTHLPIQTPILQKHSLNDYTNFAKQMENSGYKQINPFTDFPSPKRPFSMSNYLNSTPKQLSIEKDDQLPKPLEDIFNTKLIAAMTNPDTVLREFESAS